MNFHLRNFSYRTSGGRYFKVVTNSPTGSSKEKPIILDKKYANALGCILSSNLSFWFYQIYSNNLDWKGCEIENTPIPPLADDSFKEYKIGKSKAIIDKIDDLICPLYGLSSEETEFIKNYELEFRISGESE